MGKNERSQLPIAALRVWIIRIVPSDFWLQRMDVATISTPTLTTLKYDLNTNTSRTIRLLHHRSSFINSARSRQKSISLTRFPLSSIDVRNHHGRVCR
jgi:hypothetical protein